MGEEYTKQGFERDRRPPFPNQGGCLDPCGELPRREPLCNDSCGEHHKEPCREDEWDWGSWLPIILVILFFCSGGGGGLFGIGGGKEDCCDSGSSGSSSWIIILVVIFLFCSNGQNGGKGGGFLGGLF